MILGFAINSQIFGRVTLFEDNHAFRWSDVRRVVENIFYGMYQFSLFQIKKKTEGTDGNKSNGLKKLTMSVKIIGYFKVIT